MWKSIIVAMLSVVLGALCLALPTSAAPPVPPRADAKTLLGIDTPISDLVANPGAKAVLDRHLPKLTENPHYFMFEGMTLRQLAPMTDGKLTAELLAKMQAELAAIP